MRPQADKDRFILLRAEGKSWRAVAAELGISHNTCSAWEKEFKEVIAEKKRDRLNQLYDDYFLTKEARIKKLGDTLNKIDEALDKIDFKLIDPDKLLDFKIKYTQLLKQEYIPLGQGIDISSGAGPKEMMAAMADLLQRVREGEVTAEQANRESVVLSNMLRAYDANILKEQIEVLKNTLEAAGGANK